MDRKVDAYFTPAFPSERVGRFVDENPTAEWDDYLRYVIDNFPQVEDGAIQWLIEGGAAIHFLHPTRTMPEDIDIVTRSEKMAREFLSASPKINVKTVKDWFRFRRLEYSKEKDYLLFSRSTIVPFHQVGLYIFDPIALAASKTIPWGSYPKRPKDIEDIRILSVSSTSVKEFIGQLSRNS